MTGNKATAVVISMVLLALSPATAQNPTPNAPPGASAKAPPPAEAKPPTRAKRVVAPPSDADARHCLELPTNSEVIACAEKYRAR